MFMGLQCKHLARMILLAWSCSNVRYREIARLLRSGNRVIGFHVDTTLIMLSLRAGLYFWHLLLIILSTGPYSLPTCSVNLSMYWQLCIPETQMSWLWENSGSFLFNSCTIVPIRLCFLVLLFGACFFGDSFQKINCQNIKKKENTSVTRTDFYPGPLVKITFISHMFRIKVSVFKII